MIGLVLIALAAVLAAFVCGFALGRRGMAASRRYWDKTFATISTELDTALRELAEERKVAGQRADTIATLVRLNPRPRRILPPESPVDTECPECGAHHHRHFAMSEMRCPECVRVAFMQTAQADKDEQAEWLEGRG